MSGDIRYDWTRAEVRGLFALAFNELMFRAQSLHRKYFEGSEVQISTLLSIKTGGCPEDCAYCPQSARYDTGVKAEKLMALDAVLKEAAAAKSAGALGRLLDTPKGDAREPGPPSGVCPVRGPGQDVGVKARAL